MTYLPADQHQNITRGFTLLYALVILSAITGVVTSITNIMVKELQLASYGRESQIALNAAEAASECAFYWTLRGEDFDGGGSVECNGETIAVAATDPQLTVDYGDAGCAEVHVTKDGDTFSIVADGYNTCGDGPIKTQRSILRRYLDPVEGVPGGGAGGDDDDGSGGGGGGGGEGGTMTLTASADGWVRSDQPSTVQTGNLSVQLNQMVAYLKFNLSTVPGPITSATLRMRIGNTNGNAPHQAAFVSNDSWSESSITWNNRPSPGTVMDTTTVSTDEAWYSWDVTAQAEAQRTGDDTLSLAVQTASGSNDFSWNAYYDRNTASAPYLDITYGP